MREVPDVTPVFQRPARRRVLLAILLLVATVRGAAAQPDVSSIRLPAPAPYPRLDATLNRLARPLGSADAAVTSAALDDDRFIHRLGTKVAVSVRYPGSVPVALLRDFLQRRQAIVANEAEGVIETYVDVGDLAALDRLSPEIRVETIRKPQLFLVSEGAAAHNSVAWNALGYLGQGVKVGVIDSFRNFQALMGTELPATVQARCYPQAGVVTTNLADCDSGATHGTSVAEAIIDVAPEAQLYISNAFSNLDLRDAVNWMLANGVRVINFSQGRFWDGPGDRTSFQADSPLRTLDLAVAGGAVFVAAAGNHNQFTWSGGFVDANGNGYAEFAAGLELNRIDVAPDTPGSPVGSVLLQLRWDDRWGFATRDLDVGLVDPAGNMVTSNIRQNGTALAVPAEALAGTVPVGTYYVVVVRRAGAAPGWFQLQDFTRHVLHPFSGVGSISNPAESANPGMITVGAASWRTTTTIESYSSRGPTPDGRVKPDIVGTAEAQAVSAEGGVFGGTSQAAPFVAGLMALVRQRYPGLTPAQAVSYMKTQALPRGTPVPNNVWGHGFARLTDDADADGLGDVWESQMGLDFNSNAGINGASGDPDGDGRTNLQELQARTHPRGFVQRYFAEGVSNGFFDTQLALLNPSPTTTAFVLVRLQPESGGAEVSGVVIVPPRTRRTMTAQTLGAVITGPYATLIESDIDVMADRTVSWDRSGFGSHSEGALPQPSTTWLLAEGATGGPFDLFYLLQNPGDTTATVEVSYLRPAPAPPLVKTYTVAPRTRRTIWVDAERFPSDTGSTLLANSDVSASFRVVSGPAIVVERSMYFSRPGQAFAAGHQSAGVTSPATRWFLAEGATGSFFDLFVLIANPNSAAARVRVTYLTRTGQTYARDLDIAASSRQTIWVDQEQLPAGPGVRPLAAAEVSTTVESLNGVGIVVERAMWWPDGDWYEGHNAAGATAAAARWGMAEGENGGAGGTQTYVLLANVGTQPTTARVTALTEAGTALTWTSPPIPASSRLTVAMADAAFPGIGHQRFGVLVEALEPGGQLVVERAMYTNGGLGLWGAGTAALARALP